LGDGLGVATGSFFSSHLFISSASFPLLLRGMSVATCFINPSHGGDGFDEEDTTMTVQDLTNQVLDDRKKAWAKADSKTAIVATEQLNPEDEQAVRRIVAAAGYEGEELEEMVGQVSSRVVGRVEALADTLPAVGGD